jgi:hypothetical protein
MSSQNSKAESILLFFCLILFCGCAATVKETQPTEKSNLTVGTVKTEIIKGKTTQAEILKLFGAPNIITKNRSNEEVWNYNRMSFESTSGSDAGFAIFWSGSRALSSSTSKSFDLIITFDENDVVKDYSVISAQF